MKKNYREAKKSQYNNKYYMCNNNKCMQLFSYTHNHKKMVFKLRFNSTCYYFSFALLKPDIYVVSYRLMEIKTY